MTPRAVSIVLPAVATLVAANEIKHEVINAPTGSETTSTPPGKGEQAEEKPNKKKPDDNGKGGGNGEGGGGPPLPDADEPGPPNPTSEATRVPSIYQNMTMTEAGRLIEERADKPNLKPEDIEELRWSPLEMDKGWGRELQKCILKYVEKPYRQKYQPDNAALIMRTRDDGMGDPSVRTSEWMTGRSQPKIIMARACQTCPPGLRPPVHGLHGRALGFAGARQGMRARLGE